MAVIRHNTSRSNRTKSKCAKLQYFSLAFFRQAYRVIDDDSISKTALSPIFVLINSITAFKGTHCFFFRDVKSCQIRHPDVRIRYPDTSGCSHRICQPIFASYMS